MLCRLVSHPRITIDGLTRDAAHSTERGDGIDTRGALIDKNYFFCLRAVLYARHPVLKVK